MRALLFVLCSLVVALVVTGPIKPAPSDKDENWQELEGKWLANVRQLTFDLDDPEGGDARFQAAGEAYFAPDQQEIVFQAIRGDNPFYQIYTMSLRDRSVKLVSTGRGRCTCAYFHPNGEKIIFASSHLDPHVLETEAAERKRLELERQNPQMRTASLRMGFRSLHGHL